VIAPDLRASMPVRVYVDHDVYETHGQPGDVCVTVHHGRPVVAGYMMRCPGCGQESALPIASEGHAGWAVTAGDVRTGEGLTLSPSVHHTTGLGGCGWHGWVRGGRWVPC